MRELMIFTRNYCSVVMSNFNCRGKPQNNIRVPLSQTKMEMINERMYFVVVKLNVNGYEISGILDKCKMFIRDFTGSKLEAHALTAVNHPDHITLHTGA